MVGLHSLLNRIEGTVEMNRAGLIGSGISVVGSESARCWRLRFVLVSSGDVDHLPSAGRRVRIHAWPATTHDNWVTPHRIRYSAVALNSSGELVGSFMFPFGTKITIPFRARVSKTRYAFLR